MADLGLSITFLGTGSASPNQKRDNSSLLIVMDNRAVMVDCSGYPGHRLPMLGIGFDRLTDVIFTHGHIDHVYAFPSLVSSLISVMGRESMQLKVHGLSSVLDTARTLLMPFTGATGTITMNGLTFIPLYDDNGLEPLTRDTRVEAAYQDYMFDQHNYNIYAGLGYHEFLPHFYAAVHDVVYRNPMEPAPDNNASTDPFGRLYFAKAVEICSSCEDVLQDDGTTESVCAVEIEVVTTILENDLPSCAEVLNSYQDQVELFHSKNYR